MKLSRPRLSPERSEKAADNVAKAAEKEKRAEDARVKNHLATVKKLEKEAARPRRIRPLFERGRRERARG